MWEGEREPGRRGGGTREGERELGRRGGVCWREKEVREGREHVLCGRRIFGVWCL